MRWANELLREDPEQWAKTNGEGVTTGWYLGFARQNGFQKVSKNDLDVVRARWTTAANVATFYGIIYASVLKLSALRGGGVAKRDAHR